jgi:hypothetical protein
VAVVPAAACGTLHALGGGSGSAVRLSVIDDLLDDDSNRVPSLLIAYGSKLHTNMGALEQSIQVLKVITPVLDMVPAIGGNLKGAAELASEICEMIKVRELGRGYA